MINDTVSLLRTSFQDDHHLLSNDLAELHVAIQVLKQVPEGVWEEVRQESKEVALEVARGIRNAADKSATETAKVVSARVATGAYKLTRHSWIVS